MDYFLKVKNASLKVAAQGMTLIQNVGQDIGLSATSTDKRPVDDFIQRFQIICQIFDNLAKLESDVEAEKILRESKIHGHIKGFLMHLHTEDKAWHLKSLRKNVTSGHDCERPDDYSNDHVAEENSDHPCFNIFLQNRYMDELCSRGRQDKPRGCLLLVLVMITSILRNVRYPLLPYQTVHKSIYQLILDASSISSMYNSIAKSKQSTPRDFPSYVKKMDTQLLNLLSSLWVKIADNPELLNFFMFVDKRNGVKRHLDAISCLIPLMGKPKIGTIAKESLLTAISMHNSSIDSFILDDTNLTVNIVAELQKKHQNCIAALILNTSLDPVTSGTSRLSQSDAEMSNTEKTMLSAVESFVKVLHFCAAVVAAASSSSSSSADPASSPPSIRRVILNLFVDNFLKSVKSFLLENGEEQVLAAQSLLRRMLLETYSALGDKDQSIAYLDQNVPEGLVGGFARNINPLCTTLTAFVCDDEEILQVLIRRVGSVSRSVSVSAIQLLSSLLTTSSLSESCRLVIKGLSEKCPAVSLHSTPTLPPDTSSEIDGCLESFMLQHMSSHDDTTLRDYTKASVNHILDKLYCGSDSIHFDIGPEDSESDYGPLFLVSFHRLQCFLSLKYDEQLAVTGLINKCIVVLLASVLNSPYTAFVSRVFLLLSKLFESVHHVNSELLSHKAKIPEVETKYDIIREVLADPTTASASNPQSRMIVDKENQQVIRILESCVIIEELIREMEGSILAFNQLLFLLVRTASREELLSDASHVILQRSGAVMSRSWEVDESWSTDDECDDDKLMDQAQVKSHQEQEAVGESMDALSEPLTIDHFLNECESMEVQLEEVISSLSTSSSSIA